MSTPASKTAHALGHRAVSRSVFGRKPQTAGVARRHRPATRAAPPKHQSGTARRSQAQPTKRRTGFRLFLGQIRVPSGTSPSADTLACAGDGYRIALQRPRRRVPDEPQRGGRDDGESQRLSSPGSAKSSMRSSRSQPATLAEAANPIAATKAFIQGGGGGLAPRGIRVGSGVLSSSIGTGTAPVTNGTVSSPSALRVVTTPVEGRFGHDRAWPNHPHGKRAAAQKPAGFVGQKIGQSRAASFGASRQAACGICDKGAQKRRVAGLT